MSPVVELAGPAGAGKTTLARLVAAADPSSTTVGLRTGRPRLALASMGALPRLAAARVVAPGRWWTRDELRDLAYLRAWRAAVGREQDADGLLLLDHGPVFRLASLRANGPAMAGSKPFDTLWTGLARDWGRLLDVVVWLDAPDGVLLRRIDARSRAHRIRGADEDRAAGFLARYRAAYRTTLDVVTSGGARLVELDTASGSPDELAAAVRAALSTMPSRRPA